MNATPSPLPKVSAQDYFSQKKIFSAFFFLLTVCLSLRHILEKFGRESVDRLFLIWQNKMVVVVVVVNFLLLGDR